MAAPELGAGDAGLCHTQPLDSQLVYSSREDGWENVIGNWECNLMLLVEKAETPQSPRDLQLCVAGSWLATQERISGQGIGNKTSECID